MKDIIIIIITMYFFIGTVYGFYEFYIKGEHDFEEFMKYVLIGFFIIIDDVTTWINYKVTKKELINNIEKEIMAEKGISGKNSVEAIKKIKGEIEMENKVSETLKEVSESIDELTKKVKGELKKLECIGLEIEAYSNEESIENKELQKHNKFCVNVDRVIEKMTGVNIEKIYFDNVENDERRVLKEYNNRRINIKLIQNNEGYIVEKLYKIINEVTICDFMDIKDAEHQYVFSIEKYKHELIEELKNEGLLGWEE